MRRKRLKIFVLILMFLISGISIGNAQNSPYEKELKAAYLYQFLRFVQWDNNFEEKISDAYYITILGDEELVSYFDPILKKKVLGRNLVVKSVKSIKDVELSHILYISSESFLNDGKIPESIKNSGMLLVGETVNFSERNGIIGFYKKDGRIKFSINNGIAKESKIKISSKLLVLASIVEE